MKICYNAYPYNCVIRVSLKHETDFDFVKYLGKGISVEYLMASNILTINMMDETDLQTDRVNYIKSIIQKFI